MTIRPTVAAVCLAALAALTACSSDNDTTADKKPTPAVSHSTAESAYLTTTRAKIPDLKKVPDGQILDLGHSACEAVDAGNSPQAVAAKAEEGLQIGDRNSGYVIGAAISQFCPEHKDKL